MVTPLVLLARILGEPQRSWLDLPSVSLAHKRQLLYPARWDSTLEGLIIQSRLLPVMALGRKCSSILPAHSHIPNIYSYMPIRLSPAMGFRTKTFKYPTSSLSLPCLRSKVQPEEAQK